MKTQPTPETLRREAEAADWLQTHGADLEIRTGFLPASGRRLISRIEHDARRNWWNRTWAVPRFRFVVNAASLSVLFLVLGAFLSVLFSAARLALPGEQLYSVKLGVEQVQLGLCANGEQRADLYVTFARERSNELQALLIDGEYAYIEITSMRLLRQIETARLYLARAEYLSKEQQLTLFGELNQTLSLQILVLQTLVDTTPVESQPMVRHVMVATN